MKRLNNNRQAFAGSQSASGKRRGATVVEFAAVAPVVFLFIFAFFEFGRMLMVQHALSDAARDGCRQASLASITNSNDVVAHINQRLSKVIPNASAITTVTITPSWSTVGDIHSGDPIKVRIQVDHDRVSWLPAAQLLNGDGVLTAEANMDRE